MTPERIRERRCHRLRARAKRAFDRAELAYRAAEKTWLEAHTALSAAEREWMEAARALPSKDLDKLLKDELE